MKSKSNTNLAIGFIKTQLREIYSMNRVKTTIEKLIVIVFIAKD